MYSLAVRDHVMIAHSFVGEIFGPAQQLHGATFAVEMEVRRAQLDADGLVCDIGRALATLKEILAALNYRNLDELPEFRGRNTTTEFLAGEIFRRLKARIAEGALGPGTAGALALLRIVVREIAGGLGGFRGIAGVIAFLVPGALDQLTGGYLFDRHVVEGLRASGRAVDAIELGGRYPEPDTAARAAAAEALARLPDGTVTVVDGLALLAVADCLEREAKRLRIVAFVHHPLADETGLSERERNRIAALEARLLKLARGVLAPSESTARLVAAYGVRRALIAVTPPGTAKPVRLVRRRPSRSQAVFLCVASLTPRKGHLILVEGLAALADRSWTCRCIGSLMRDPETASAVRYEIGRRGLKGRIALEGEWPPERLGEAYAEADCAVLPSFHEGYGMALAEALAHGLPVISTTAGAIPDTVPPSAGLLVPPGDAAAFTEALRRFLDEPPLRARLAAGARKAGARLPDWPRAVADWAAALDRLTA